MPGEAPKSTMQRALLRLEAIDPVAAQDARTALEWLLGSDPDVDVIRREVRAGDDDLDELAGIGGAALPETMNRFALQQFCWYELPFKWIVTPHVSFEIVHSLGRFFDLASMPRYGELCRSPRTIEVLAAWQVDPAEGYRAFRRAMDTSGLEPPSIDELKWNSVMEPEEFAAFWSTATALELAVDAGVVVPGSRGWRTQQAEVARAHLLQPRDERFGESLAQGVISERLVLWVERGDPSTSPSLARRQMLAPLTNALLATPAVPRGVGRSLERLTWLLDRIAAGVVLTAKGRLPRTAVRDAVMAFPRWWPASLGMPRADLESLSRENVAGSLLPRREEDVRPLVLLHRFAMTANLARRRGRQLVLTERGRAAMEDPAELWRACVDTLAVAPTFDGAVVEAMLAALLNEPLVDPYELEREVLVVMTESGWHRGATGEPVPFDKVRSVLADTEAVLTELGAVRSRGTRPPTRRLRLTVAGRATAIAALRARAVAPHRI